jgi:hypothetical protein
MPTIRHLLEPILEGGVHRTNWFNGRVLTAEDLRADQEANRLQRMLLGRTVGEGVLYGLEVTRSASTRVQITPGAAISRAGQVLTMPGTDPVLLEIVPDTTAAARQPGNFYDCAQQVVSSMNTGYGLYLLTALPSGGYEGSAPSTGVTGSGVITGCGKKYAVDGIQFRLAAYRTDSSLPEYQPLRNLVAYDFFGVRDLAYSDLSELLTGRTAYGEYDAIYADGKIAAEEVPLALLYWDGAGIDWVDMWAVRRQVAPVLSGSPWDVMFGPRRQAETEAMFMQFRADLADYRQESNNPTPLLRQRFRYLPPVGALPVNPNNGEEQTAQQLDAYFNMWYERYWVYWPYLRTQMAQAALTAPIDLLNESEPLINVVWEGGMPEAIFFRGSYYYNRVK